LWCAKLGFGHYGSLGIKICGWRAMTDPQLMRRGEVYVFLHPAAASALRQSDCWGLPGDRIDIMEESGSDQR